MTIAIRPDMPRGRSAVPLTVALVLASLVVGACDDRDSVDRLDEEMTDTSIEQVLQERTPEWLSIPGVVGTAIGECEGTPCIRILVERKTPELVEQLPSVVDGFVVDIQETGPIRALDRREPE
jgi:hypothetical protein